MNLKNIIKLTEPYCNEDLIAFVRKGLKQAKPKRTGWKYKEIESLCSEYKLLAAKREEEINLDYKKSEYYQAHAKRERKQEKKYLLPLQKGQSMIFDGHQFLCSLTGKIIKRPQKFCNDQTGYWLSEGVQTPYHQSPKLFVPNCWELKVELLSAGDAHMFATYKISRIK